MNRRLLLPILIAAALLPRVALAQGMSAQPMPDRELDRIPRLKLPAVDLNQARRDDEDRVLRGHGPQYAVALEVNVTPWQDGQWWEIGRLNHARWRLRVSSPGALSLNLAFSRFKMPPEGELVIYSPDGRHRIGPFTEVDNEEHGELWTPPLLTDDLILEVTLPLESIGELDLRLTKIHHGYAGFGEDEPKSGPCEVDLACTPAEIWRDVARSVALVSIEGVRFCTGFLVNNTALDGRPFFITAHHCGVTPQNAASVVVLWNHESPVCRDEATGEPPGDLSQFQTGAIFRAAYRPSDVVLIELDDAPDPAFNVFYAGWDRSMTNPRRTVVIHHPNTDVKRISFDYDRATATPHLGNESLPQGNHLRIADWDLGTTEGGSSGAPLFNQDMRVVGQLHGGYATCDDRQADWFGRMSASWTGKGRPGLRLSDWLDPLGSEALTLDGIEGAAVSSEAP